jgi:hypothetical protein
LPIIFISANADETSTARALRSGAIEFLESRSTRKRCSRINSSLIVHRFRGPGQIGSPRGKSGNHKMSIASSPTFGFDQIIGESPAVRETINLITLSAIHVAGTTGMPCAPSGFKSPLLVN